MNWWHWHPDPGVVEGLSAMTVLYLLGARQQVWWRKLCFHLGTLLVFLAVGSPLDEISEKYLFTAHMLQHIILIYPVPVLWLLGIPRGFFEVLLAMEWSAPLLRFFCRPAVALLTFNLVFYFWHVPALYEWALRDDKIHFLEHATFMGTAVIQWIPLVRPLYPFHYAGQLLYLLVGVILQSPLFFMLAFMNRCFYPTYLQAPRICFMSPAVDQQSGAILMKLAAMLVMFVALIIIFGRWYHEENAGFRPRSVAGPET